MATDALSEGFDDLMWVDPGMAEGVLRWQCLQQADAAPKAGHRQHDLPIVADYFLVECPGLSEKRSIVVSTFTSMATCSTLRD